METLLTVLITLMVVALGGAGINLVRLNQKADELDTLKLDMIDINDSINRMIENLEKDLNRNINEVHKDSIDRIDKWVASTDRRFDKAYNDIHKLDTVVNPNKDFLRKSK
jgi:biotin-(acetyl-CoA carboxylase) ligase